LQDNWRAQRGGNERALWEVSWGRGKTKPKNGVDEKPGNGWGGTEALWGNGKKVILDNGKGWSMRESGGGKKDGVRNQNPEKGGEKGEGWGLGG